MIARLGVSIHATELCAVLVEGRSIRWRASVDRGASDSVGDGVMSMLSNLPKSVGIRRATIAIGPSGCHVKQLEGLPNVGDAATLTRLVHENAAAFFIGGDRHSLSEVARLDKSRSWAAAFDREMLAAAIDAVKRYGFLSVRVVPSAVALAPVLSAEMVEWADGDSLIEIRASEKRLVSVRRLTTCTNRPPSLGELGETSWAMGAAFGAATLPKSSPLVWRPAPDPSRTATWRRIHMSVSIAVLLGSTVFATFAPGIRATLFLQSASAELKTARASQTEFARLQGEMRRQSLTLERAADFQAQRGKITVLLGALSQALPESVALVSLRVDSLEGSFVALARDAAEVLPQIAAVADVIAPRIVGSLTRETVGGARVQRATVRFRRASLLNRAKPARARG